MDTSVSGEQGARRARLQIREALHIERFGQAAVHHWEHLMTVRRRWILAAMRKILSE